uniref:Uncharacterized protein n=1 Tax=Lepeophtheirus salmonis TaxID=72036 RepID=A0A0K2SZD9_LEPSM
MTVRFIGVTPIRSYERKDVYPNPTPYLTMTWARITPLSILNSTLRPTNTCDESSRT